MIFHLGYELPKPVSQELNESVPGLTEEEIRILKNQIRKNSLALDDYIQRLDLFVNKEKYPHRAVFLEKLRRRVELLMAENDTFRSVLWKHYQREELQKRLKKLKKP